MTGPELDALIANARSGSILTMRELSNLVEHLVIYRAQALRLERCVHELVKEVETCRP